MLLTVICIAGLVAVVSAQASVAQCATYSINWTFLTAATSPYTLSLFLPQADTPFEKSSMATQPLVWVVDVPAGTIVVANVTGANGVQIYDPSLKLVVSPSPDNDISCIGGNEGYTGGTGLPPPGAGPASSSLSLQSIASTVSAASVTSDASVSSMSVSAASISSVSIVSVFAASIFSVAAVSQTSAASVESVASTASEESLASITAVSSVSVDSISNAAVQATSSASAASVAAASQSALAAASQTSIAAASQSSFADASPQSIVPAGKIAGGVVGGVVGLAILTTILYVLRWKRLPMSNSRPPTQYPLAQYPPTHPQPPPNVRYGPQPTG